MCLVQLFFDPWGLWAFAVFLNRLGEVSPCERSENYRGGAGEEKTSKMQHTVVRRVSKMLVLQPLVPLGSSGTVPGPPVGCWRTLTKHCYMRCFLPAAAAAASNPIADLAGFRSPPQVKQILHDCRGRVKRSHTYLRGPTVL